MSTTDDIGLPGMQLQPSLPDGAGSLWSPSAEDHGLPSYMPAVSGIAQPALKDDASTSTPSMLKREDSNTDVNQSPGMLAPATNDVVARSNDKDPNANDGSDVGTSEAPMTSTNNESTDIINGTATANADINSPAPVVECRTFANLERVRFGGQQTIADGVKVGVTTLDGLHDLLSTEAKEGNEAARWLARFDSLKQKLKETRTVVGIVGNTGAGKSSLINAILDEENIIPTNCMRACTAVATEICYNHDDEPGQSYRGEVEFVTEEDWRNEVTMLLGELVDPTKKLSKDYLQHDTGAGVAYAKIKAVYPHLTNDKLTKSDVEDLMDDTAVKHVLGSVKSHVSSNASDLKSELQIYVDSAEKDTPGARSKKAAMAYWPLIKVVRIYLKSKILSTGTVLVDLPGIQDSNAARSAVADRFKAECSSIWIVSPINRAVDDKAAKHLLGTSFKLQLTMDGQYSNVTFICSKTDQISVEEVAEKMDTDGTIHTLWTKEEECKRNLARLKEEMQALTEERDEVDELRDELEARKPKKRKLANQDSDANVQDPDLVKFQEESANVRKQLVRIRKRLRELKAEIPKLESKCDKLGIDATALCVEARNNYSMNAIRADFADGVRDMLEDADAQDADMELPASEPDYAHIAQSLPVFCVSSRGYQSLMGRTKDEAIRGYRTLADTQIPQLQKHAMHLGELELTSTRKAFIGDLGRLFRSLLLWTTGDRSSGDANTLTDQEMAMISRLDTLITDLRVELERLIDAAVASIKAKTKQDLLAPISAMCSQASYALRGIASEWPNKNALGTGPLKYATYRSICFNQGKGTTRYSKGMDFNEDLFIPLKQRMAVHWASTFERTFTDGMAIYASGEVQALTEFHKCVQSFAHSACAQTGSLAVLDDQLNARIQAIRQAEAKFKVSVRLEQRTGSRWFVKNIAAYMKQIYEKCATMHGTGCYNRMKEAMVEFVDIHSQEMFAKALEDVAGSLAETCSTFERHMRQHAEHFLVRMKEDYQTAILGREMVLSGNDASVTLNDVQEKSTSYC